MPAFEEIDLARLEEHWVEHPKLYQQYADMLAQAKKKQDEANRLFELAEADAKMTVRKNPAKYGVTKLTDGAVKEVYVKVRAYQDALLAVNKAKHRVDVLVAAINSLEHRKRALENLVTLFGQNYFSRPQVSKAANSKFLEDADHRKDKASVTRKRKI